MLGIVNNPLMSLVLPAPSGQRVLVFLACWLALVAVVSAQPSGAGAFSPGARVLLNAHNCYPEHGKHLDRIDRALSTGFPLAIEQDIAWHKDPATGKAWSVLSHETRTHGDEPTIDNHFFERLRPAVEAALREGDRGKWPIAYLHFNFKTSEREHVEHVLATLMRYKAWLSSARRTADPLEIAPIEYGPILVMTETNATERAIFHDEIPVGERFSVFGSAPGEAYMPRGLKREEQFRRLVETPPQQMLKAPADNYRRWWNNPWAVVEAGGPPLAGEWTSEDAARLKALVDHAHSLGYLIRFYTLNGHPREQASGWGSGYNFGQLEAARTRWQAAVDAKVDFIATDQYEGLGELLRNTRR
ncbi:MAG: hypothetical protein MUF01_15765 [Bryobacterales bacterium]|nr:hypothetical protein [Bryobacterales bacterium]